MDGGVGIPFKLHRDGQLQLDNTKPSATGIYQCDVITDDTLVTMTQYVHVRGWCEPLNYETGNFLFDRNCRGKLIVGDVVLSGSTYSFVSCFKLSRIKWRSVFTLCHIGHFDVFTRHSRLNGN